MKLPVAEVHLLHIPEPVLVVERFDRAHEDRKVRRLPAIDGCQALGLSVGFKYERPYGDSPDVRDIRDGASLPKLFKLTGNTARPIAERRALLRWVIYQVLIGNTDAHAKNLTYLVDEGGLMLAPAYDLVCGLAFEEKRIVQTYAMAIGDAFSADDLTAMEWATLCLAVDLPPAMVRKEIEVLARDTLGKLDVVTAEVSKEGIDAAVVAKIVPIVAAECHRQAEMARLIPDMVKYELKSRAE